MKSFLFSAEGRFNRAKFWKANLSYIFGAIITGMIAKILAQVIPSEVTGDGSYSVHGLAAVPFVILIFGFIFAVAWSAVVTGIKRYHDRGKSGIWVLIPFVPLIGLFWYFIEAGCLKGTPGPNQYGAGPR